MRLRVATTFVAVGIGVWRAIHRPTARHVEHPAAQGIVFPIAGTRLAALATSPIIEFLDQLLMLLKIRDTGLELGVTRDVVRFGVAKARMGSTGI